jgi:hypothetical protein
MIGRPIKNISGGRDQHLPAKAKIGGDHVALRRVGNRFNFIASPQEKKYSISHWFQIVRRN